ncbi:hypothetical protein [Micromonospora sp. NPDC049891]|uniref:hypothetical protein n=1 Tax=Micromonospora sp. NPDC049891 TaxID=3155655 RepID=UPI0033F9478E
MEAARRVDGSVGAFHRILGVASHAGHRSPHVRRPWSGNRSSPAQLTTRARRAGAAGHARGTADLGRAGAARRTADPAATNRSAADATTAHRASSCGAADPATTHRPIGCSAAGLEAHLTVTRHAAWPSGTAVDGAAVGYGAVRPATGSAAAHRGPAGGATGADGLS